MCLREKELLLTECMATANKLRLHQLETAALLLPFLSTEYAKKVFTGLHDFRPRHAHTITQPLPTLFIQLYGECHFFKAAFHVQHAQCCIWALGSWESL